MDTVAAILAGEQLASRRALGRRVCEEFGFRDRLGRLQVATCLQALHVLAERSERIVLPTPAGVVNGGGKPSLLAAGASLAESVPERLQGVEKLCVQRVGKRSQRQIWNTLIGNEHRLERRPAPSASAPRGGPESVPDPGRLRTLGEPRSGTGAAAPAGRFPGPLRVPSVGGGDLL